MTMASGHWVHNLNPVLVQLGPVAIRWYGLMYLIGFGIAYFLLRWCQERGLLKVDTREAVQDLLFYGFCGVLIGGRLGHCFFYEPGHYLRAPWEIVMVWHGGMSSHGGFVGVMVALWLYARRHGVSFWHVMDNAVYAATPGLFFGRLGNFINAELCGRVTHVPWAVIFPTVDHQPRHPVQLYQALMEGVLTFVILLIVGRKERPVGMLSGIFAVVYAAGRLFTERFREPSPVLEGPLGLGLTQGQFLSLFVLAIGIGLVVNSLRTANKKS